MEQERDPRFYWTAKLTSVLFYSFAIMGGIAMCVQGIKANNMILISLSLLTMFVLMAVGNVIGIGADSYHIREKRPVSRSLLMTCAQVIVIMFIQLVIHLPSGKFIAMLAGAVPGIFLFDLSIRSAGRVGDWLEAKFLVLFNPSS